MLDASVIVFNREILDAYQAAALDVFNYMANTVGTAIAPILPDLTAQLQREPGAVVYPIQWKSKRQQRAFFATNGFGSGIPYKRTHRLSQGYRVIYQRTGDNQAQLTAENDAAALRFVKGAEQQPFHFNTGWDSDLATYMWYEQKLFDACFPAIIAAWQPDAVKKAYGT